MKDMHVRLSAEGMAALKRYANLRSMTVANAAAAVAGVEVGLSVG